MNIHEITEKFSQGIKWNALLYVIKKSLGTILTVALFYRLTLKDFSLWANIQSAIFLSLLWLDFGFKKSLPRFCPEFAKNNISLQRFTKNILIFQGIILCVASPIFFIAVKHLTFACNLTNKCTLLYLGCLLFIIEGIIAILRLLYHAHFWQKEFNLHMSIVVTIQTIINLLLIFAPLSSQQIVNCIFLTAIGSGITIVTTRLFALRKLYKNKYFLPHMDINDKKTVISFIKHSGILWASSNLKSLTERNFMVPFLTATFGPVSANLFKVANDGALLFYRMITKTIGTTDTSLFAYTEMLKQSTKFLPLVFKKITLNIISLSIPMLGMLFTISYALFSQYKDWSLFSLFIVITSGYLLESLLSPYERVLEVKKCYNQLAIAYLPYAALVICMLVGSIQSVDLLVLIAIIHGVRILSLFISVYAAKSRYRLPFPFKFLVKTLLITSLISITFCLILKMANFAFFLYKY